MSIREKALLRKKFDAWKAEHLRPWECISLSYFVEVLHSGESDHARNWGKKPLVVIAQSQNTTQPHAKVTP